MLSCQPLIYETRGDVVEQIRMGWIAVVDERSRLIASVGDPQAWVYYRSASKPIQALPVIVRGLDEQYGLTPRETAIFAGSHAGEPIHVAALESMWCKADLSEDMMVMQPTLPESVSARAAVLAAGGIQRRAYHNCSGKHTALILLQRALTGDVRDYWRPESPAQREVLQTVATLSEFPADEIRVGIDGCGVPVFALALQNIAIGFKNLACPDAIADDALRAAAEQFVPRMHAFPEMIKGPGTLCTRLNACEGVVAKGGANGVYGLGLKKERLGIALKLADGLNVSRPLVLAGVLRQLGYDDPEVLAVLDDLSRVEIRNDNDLVVGRAMCAFHLQGVK